MALVDDLLTSGIVVQHPTETGKVIFNVDFNIKKAAVNLGAFEVFAKAYGWTPKIEGSDGVEVDNPVTCHDKCKEVVRGFAKEVFTARMLDHIREQANEQGKEQLKDLL